MQPLTARFVPYGIRGGQENMAIDEYLLLRHGHAGVPVLRLYGWKPPAISLGRYQGIECLDRDACLGDGVTVVRRITGGGAIFHNNELTYSVVWPAGNPETHESNAGSFMKINAFIIEMYRSLGMNPMYAKDAGRESSPGRPNFCFSGNEDYDILIEGRKIGGNAQRRVKGALLQHGSIPLAGNTDRVQRYFRDLIDNRNFTYLNEACGHEVGIEELAGRIMEAFCSSMGVDFSAQEIDDSEENVIRYLVQSRYSLDQWNFDGTANEV